MRRCILLVLGTIVLVLGMLVPAVGIAGADVYRYTDPNGDTVRLMDEACPTASGWLKMRRGELIFRGKRYAACWVVVQQHVVVIDDSGDVSAVPAQLFTKETGV